MKVFEVITERLEEDDKVTTMQQYVTCSTESLSDVAEHFHHHCEAFGEILVGVRYVLTVVEHISVSSDD